MVSAIAPLVTQSPMANTTDLAFRLIAREHGLRFAYLEMISSEALVRDSEKTKDLLKSMPEDRPLGAQIVGCNPEVMGRAAAILDAMQEFEVLDINLGCPVPKVTGPGGGSALLREPEKARAIFTQVKGSTKRLPVTVKMRIGYSDTSAKEAIRIAQIAEECGLAAVAVHGRTRSQGYSGKADYEAIGKIKRAVSIPVIGNGDVVDAQSALRLREISGCDGVMIGRGALGNPWIYQEVEAALTGNNNGVHPDFEMRKTVLLRHLDLQSKYDGPRCYLPMRRIACWYMKGTPNATRFREQVNKAQSVEEVRTHIEEYRP
jgi:tRNA-dihydrouridine synthase B